MKNIVSERTSATMFIGTPDNFSNIINNEIAKEFLLKASEEKSREDIFEIVYSAQFMWGEEMKKRRALRREYLNTKGLKKEPSFLNTQKKEQDYYDITAHDVAVEAMSWLDKVKGKAK